MAHKLKTHFAMQWYRMNVCGSGSAQWSSVPAEVTCYYCRRYNLSERAKQTGPAPPVVVEA